MPLVILIRPGWGEKEEGRTPARCLSLDRSLINNRRQGETAAAAPPPPPTSFLLPLPPPTKRACERQQPRQLSGTNQSLLRVSKRAPVPRRSRLWLRVNVTAPLKQFSFDRLEIKLKAPGADAHLSRASRRALSESISIHVMTSRVTDGYAEQIQLIGREVWKERAGVGVQFNLSAVKGKKKKLAGMPIIRRQAAQQSFQKRRVNGCYHSSARTREAALQSVEQTHGR